MRLSLRFILPLAITLAAIAYAVVPLVDRLTLQWFVRDLDIRTSLITRTIQEPLGDLVREGSRAKILRYFDRLIQDERLFAVGFCDPQRRLLYKTVTFPSSHTCTGRPPNPMEVEGRVVNLERGPVHVVDYDLEADGKSYGHLVLVHDMSFVQRRSDDTKKYIFFLFAALAAIVSLVTVVIAEVSWRGGSRAQADSRRTFGQRGEGAHSGHRPVAQGIRRW
jgi:trehalose 6-phosphate synthase